MEKGLFKGGVLFHTLLLNYLVLDQFRQIILYKKGVGGHFEGM